MSALARQEKRWCSRINEMLILLYSIVWLAHCKAPERKTEPVPVFVSGVYVTNEGNFQYGNSSVSYRDEKSEQVTSDVYYAANQSPLGDICQSMTPVGAYYYIVVNGSAKVEVVDTASFHSVKTITGCQSPRYLLPVSSEKAYLTDLYDNKIHLVNLLTHEINGGIAIPTWTEAMILFQTKVFVSAPHSPFILVVNTNNDQVIDSIAVGQGVNSLVLDKNNTLWAISDGDLGAHDPFIVKINPVEDTIVEQQLLAHTGSNLSLSADRSTLYWLENGVVSLPVDSAITSRKTIVSGTGHNWHALGVHPLTEELYVSDALDYLQNSKIFLYSKDGVYKTSFSAGVISGSFYFKVEH